jgi:predicted DNA-binding protein
MDQPQEIGAGDVTSIRLTESLRIDLDQVCSAYGLSRSDLARQAVERYLKDLDSGLLPAPKPQARKRRRTRQ